MKLLMFFLLFSDPNEFPLFPLSSLCHASEAAQIFNLKESKPIVQNAKALVA